MKTKLIIPILAASFCVAPAFSVDVEKPSEPRVTETAKQRQAFLGVDVQNADDALRTQLSLPAEEGLVVRELAPDSAAAKAGVKQHDVLLRLNDTPLRSPAQLSQLVGAMKEGDSVRLTLIRAGREQALEAKLGGRDFSARPLPGDRPRGGEQWRDMGRAMEDVFRTYRGDARDAQNKIREKIEKLRDDASGSKDSIEEQLKSVREQVEKAIKDAGAKIDLDGIFKNLPQVNVITTPGSSEIHISTVTNGSAQIVDGEGRIEIEGGDGAKKLKAWDSDGKEVFSGPWNTDDDKAKAPQSVRDRAERVNVDVKTFKFPGARTEKRTAKSTAGSAEATVRVQDESGEILRISKDGRQTVKATDKAGKVVFEGDWNTDDDKAKAPADVRERIEKGTANVHVETKIITK